MPVRLVTPQDGKSCVGIGSQPGVTYVGTGSDSSQDTSVSWIRGNHHGEGRLHQVDRTSFSKWQNCRCLNGAESRVYTYEGNAGKGTVYLKLMRERRPGQGDVRGHYVQRSWTSPVAPVCWDRMPDAG